MNSRHLYMLSLLLLITAAGRVDASNLQDHDSIRAAARAFIAQRHPWQSLESHIEVSRLDGRSRLPRCNQALRSFLPTGARIRHRTTVGIQCPDNPGWKVYLPVTVTAFASVLVATRPLPPGTVVQRSDVQTVKRDIASLGYGYIGRLDENRGYRTTRSVSQGAVLTPVMVEDAVMIRRGQKVTLLAKSGPVSVSMAGIATSEGSLGKRISVKNITSGRELEGIVRSAETVEIAL